MDFLLLAILCYLNGRKAKLKGLPVGKWVLFTVLGFVVTTVIGVIFVLALFFPVPKTEDPAVMQAELVTFFTEKPVHMWFIIACGVGGYLFVRHRIEKAHPIGNDNLPPE